MNIGHRIQVGTDGFVELIDWMGNDERVVDAARISYGQNRESHDLARDTGLIRYMMRHGHTTPFEQCEVAFAVRVPMDTWRQWIRHRTANVNEYSTRYTDAIDERLRTPSDGWRLQSDGNKQGSGGMLSRRSVGTLLSERELELHELSTSIYQERLSLGVAREQARKDLPLSTYTEAYWKVDLHNLLGFLYLRLDSHAQLEIREYAQAVAEITEALFPIVWQAFLDYRINAVTLTALDIEAIQAQLNMEALESSHEYHTGNGREVTEFKNKLARIMGLEMND